MGNKRTRNRIPALPLAMKNLLALHSLEAWPAKYAIWSNGAKLWAWKITKAGDNHITSKALWTVKGSRDLEFWVQQVDIWKARPAMLSLDFETYSDTRTGRQIGLSQTAIYIDELSEIRYR